MKTWKKGDVIMATDVNRWEASVATFTTTVDGGNITINDIGYDELKAIVLAGRLPRVIYTSDVKGNVQTSTEAIFQVAIEATKTGEVTGEYLVTTPTALSFEKQPDGSAMATL